MSIQIEAITKTKEKASEIVAKILTDPFGKSEEEIKDEILSEIKNHDELFPFGWYDPPPGGVAILFDKKPFTRLQFQNLRDQAYWPKNDLIFDKESVAIIYFSPVDKETKMLGDVGFTAYIGGDPKIKKHLRKCYELLYSVAEYAKVGMKFKDLAVYGKELFKNNGKTQKWITVLNDPERVRGINLGHTIPGSFEYDASIGNSFEEIRENIRIERVFVDESENFTIPKTCAFTIEARLTDIKNEHLPNSLFHFIVTFDSGEKRILENYDNIFKELGMEYML